MAHSHAMPSPVALPGVAKIVAVGSGKGGVGKTTVAVNLAIALSKLGQRVGLMDADVYGPNVPLMMGSTQQPTVGPGNMIEPNLTHGIKTISIGYISPGDKPLVMRGPMLHQIIRQFLQQVNWGELDYLIVDLPPGTGDVVISLVQTVPLTGAVVVSTPSDVSLEDARKALEMFAPGQRRGAGHRREHEPLHLPALPPGDRHLLARRRGAHGEAVQRAVPGIDRAGSRHSRRRRPRTAGGAGRTQEPAGRGVLRRCGKADGARRSSRLPRRTDVIEIS